MFPDIVYKFRDKRTVLPGTFAYGRNHADGANMLAEAVAPYGGTIIWRCFVYNCQQDWRDEKTDRARAGYDNFAPLWYLAHSNRRGLVLY